jgi:hypothetical protein
MEAVKMKYNGKYGYGKIGSFPITSKTPHNRILKEISETLINKMRKQRKAEGTQFIIETYITKDYGLLEMIKDTNGKIYGFDHGSCSAWGFQK